MTLPNETVLTAPRPTPRPILPGGGRPPDSWGGFNSAINRAYANQKAADAEAKAQVLAQASAEATALVQAAVDAEAAAVAEAAAHAQAAHVAHVAHAAPIAQAAGVSIPAVVVKPKMTARAAKIKSAAAARAAKSSAKAAAKAKAALEAASSESAERAQASAAAQSAADAQAAILAEAAATAEVLRQIRLTRIHASRVFVEAAANAAERTRQKSQRARQAAICARDAKASNAVDAAFRGEAVRNSALHGDTSDDGSSSHEPGYPFSDDGLRSRMADRLSRLGYSLDDPDLQPFLQRRSASGDGGLDEYIHNIVDQQHAQPAEVSDGSDTEPAYDSKHQAESFYNYNFANTDHYSSLQPIPGSSTAADRLTLYRRTGEVQWRVIPEGMIVPRAHRTHGADAARIEKECIANGISCRDYLFSGLPGRTIPALIPHAAPPPPSALAGAPNLHRRLQMMGMAVRFDPDQVLPSESDGSGSNFSADGKPKESSDDDDDVEGVSGNHSGSDGNGEGEGEDGEGEDDEGEDGDEVQGEDDEDGEDVDEDDDEAEHDTEDEEENTHRKGKGVDPREWGKAAAPPGSGGDPDDESGSDSGGDGNDDPKGKGKQHNESESDESDKESHDITGMFESSFYLLITYSLSYLVS